MPDQSKPGTRKHKGPSATLLADRGCAKEAAELLTEISDRRYKGSAVYARLHAAREAVANLVESLMEEPS